MRLTNQIRMFVCPLLLGAVLALVGCGNEDAGNGGGGTTKRRIAVIPKGTTHVFWTAVEKGARKGGEETGVEVIWKGPLAESDRSAQIQIVQQFVSEGVDGIVLAPLDSRALLGPVKAAADANIPVVIFDSALDGEQGVDFVAFVATDNTRGGELGGEEMGRLIGGKGKVVLLRYQVGSASTTKRENGFLAAVAKHTDIQVISDNQFAGATSGEAQNTALNLIDTLKEADGIFTPNESATTGMLQALRKEGLAGKVRFVGFDASPVLVEALRKGEIDALVVQNPRKMGYLGVKTIVAYLDGESIDPVVDTDVVVVTRENMDDAQIKPLIE